MTSALTQSANSQQSISVSLAILGDWNSLPEVNTPFHLSCEPVEATWREDLIARGWESGVFEKSILKHLRSMPSVIFAELTFQPYIDLEKPNPFPSRQLRWARATVKLFKQLATLGAAAFYFDGSLKVFTPDLINEVDPKDDTTLFHLFVEVWGDDERVATEGMSIFGLPDVVTLGLDPQSAEAQATTFSAAAQLVCDELVLSTGSHFRSSESFPWCEASWSNDLNQMKELLGLSPQYEEVNSSDESDPVNSAGICSLHPVSLEEALRLTQAWHEIEALD